MPDNTINWGILGPGSISTDFAQGIEAVPDAKIVAVGSRDLDRAKSFADTFNVPNAYGSYQALVADPDVDIIYIGTPHNFHKDHTLLSLNAGKHVLCEKPFAINTTEAEEMITTSRQKGLFLMEAMCSRHLPALVKVCQLIAEEAIGKIRMVQADFGFRTVVNPEGRLFKLDLGGGALLDVGIYPLSLAHMILGTPDRITSLANLGSTGVDEQTAFILGYDSGEIAVLSTAIRTKIPHGATIIGTDGWIRINSPWWMPDNLTLNSDGQEQTISCPLVGNGYNYEAVEAGDCIRAGKTESDIMPLDETLALMKIMDQIRSQIGLKYPME
ncbi:MAG: Gfo/Idh/MocA family oxidoreductase [Pseudomonadota bacterium]